jgi:hypothetical protein
LPGWQQFYAARPNSSGFELVGIACEHNGRENARPYVEAAGVTFPHLVDEHGTTVTAFGFKVVPNGVLIDEDGIVRYRKFGGFDVRNPDDLASVERFAGGDDPGPSPDGVAPDDISPVEQELIATHLSYGNLLISLGRKDEGVAEWRAALRVDPQNLVIRKQIWAALHPEKFEPTIDWDWQRETIARERAEELAAGVCGPDGCPLPRG